MNRNNFPKHNQSSKHQIQATKIATQTPRHDQTQHRQRHQRIPSQPILLSKNGRQSFSPQRLANIKGTVSGTFVPTLRFSEERLLRLTDAVCQRFVISSKLPETSSLKQRSLKTGGLRRSNPADFCPSTSAMSSAHSPR